MTSFVELSDGWYFIRDDGRVPQKRSVCCCDEETRYTIRMIKIHEMDFVSGRNYYFVDLWNANQNDDDETLCRTMCSGCFMLENPVFRNTIESQKQVFRLDVNHGFRVIDKVKLDF